MDSPLALYRRYRPETFAEVIGQEHVTTPLRAALQHNRVNHAYLFSGPRGCGKTTSARILARALNCAQAPIADPCGECDSCRELGRGGPGSIDVIEIDAASHGGVDDARDLREKAFFAPVRDRYKVYIIDEAHMVSSQGFNALLKLVEEPPPHLRFIFATTEPEKVIATIRSRTHHYPFRLIPPRLLSSYLSQLCESEGVAIDHAALPLVVRAGAGSARDTLSVLDQLIGGSGPEGVTHQLVTGLLGFTPDTLLDEVVDAFAAADGSAVFGVVDKVIETGQDPRRFTEDLLRRLRDLVIVDAVPDASATGIIEVSEDQGERLVSQAARFGAHDLSRAADLVATGLTEMRGATAPRLLLELICARVLLPGADDSVGGLGARLDRMEKRVGMTGGAPSGTVQAPPPQQQSAAPVVEQRVEPSAAQDPAPRQQPPVSPPDQAPVRPAAPAPMPESPADGPVGGPPSPVPWDQQESSQQDPDQPQPRSEQPAPAVAAESPAQVASEPTAVAGGSPGGLSLVEVRRLWPDIVDATKTMRRLVWMLLTQHAQVLSAEGDAVTIGFDTAGPRESFVKSGGDEVLRQAAIDVVGQDWRIDAIVDPGATPGDGGGQTAHSSPPDSAAPDPESPRASAEQAAPAPSSAPEPVRSESPPAEEPAPSSESAPAGMTRLEAVPEPPASYDRDDAVDPDDPEADSNGLDSAALLERTLGARVIEEIPHE